MTDIKTVRDHSQPCDHKQAFQEHPDGPWECRRGVRAGRCPGGKEIRLHRLHTVPETVGGWVEVDGND